MTRPDQTSDCDDVASINNDERQHCDLDLEAATPVHCIVWQSCCIAAATDQSWSIIDTRRDRFQRGGDGVDGNDGLI
jgi:hypothetical protein